MNKNNDADDHNVDDDKLQLMPLMMMMHDDGKLTLISR
jgi:hypothetical protein